MSYGNYAPFYRNNYFNPTPNPLQGMPMQEGAGQYMTPNYQMPQPSITPSTLNDMVWVLNENEAVSYPVAPNNSVTLWDKNESVVYIKSVNSQGVPSMRVLDYTERNTAKPKESQDHVCKCGDNFVTKEVFENLKNEFEALTEKVNSFVSNKRTTKQKEADE